MDRSKMNGNIEEKITVTKEMKGRIVDETRAQGMKLKELADAISYHSKYLSNILNGHTEASSSIIYSIADALGVRIEYLLCIDNIRTENDFAELYGHENIRAHNCTLDYLNSLGVKTAGIPAVIPSGSELIEEEYYRMGSDPSLYRRKKVKDADGIRTLENLTFYQVRKNDGTVEKYITTPDRAVTILEEFNKLAQSLFISLLETGACNYDQLSDDQYRSLFIKENNMFPHKHEEETTRIKRPDDHK